MQTHFTAAQLQDPKLADANDILRSCVHCGFCTATCPTYVLLGDELDSPRGRIYLIKQMLEEGRAATETDAKHIDRCLSCLSCMTTCPSGVNYMHLIDTARVHVEETFHRPFTEQLARNVLAFTMPRPGLFRYAMAAAWLVKPIASILGGAGFPRLKAMLNLVPASLPTENLGRPGFYAAQGKSKGRVSILRGCVQSVTAPSINAAAIRLLNRQGFDVSVSAGESCCGSLPHHLGKDDSAKTRARRMIDQWTDENPDHIVITASGCGTTIKDYGHMFRDEPVYAAQATAIASIAKDITEVLDLCGLPQLDATGVRVTYHSACSMQHGQKLTTLPQKLLRRAGFTVSDVPEGHLCCGSAGTYNMLQPDIADQLKARKLDNIATTRADIIAAGNLGCITQLQSGLTQPMLHTIELLDWAYGGPKPEALKDMPHDTSH